MTKLNGTLTTKKAFQGTIKSHSSLSGSVEKGLGSGGTSDYERIRNKPMINDVELMGNKTSEDLGLVSDTQYATREKHGLVRVGANLFIDVEGNLEAEATKSTPLTNLEIERLLGN